MTIFDWVLFWVFTALVVATAFGIAYIMYRIILSIGTLAAYVKRKKEEHRWKKFTAYIGQN